MNELPPLPDPKAAAPAVVPAPAASTEPPILPPEPPRAAASATMGDFARQPLTVAVIVLGLLLAAETWYAHDRLRDLRRDMARSLQRGDAMNAETGKLAGSVLETSKELQAKVSVLENRQLEAQSQQLALEQLYQDLSKNRDEWALAEIEQVLSTASQQLQLSGNIQGALIALQNADRSLSRSDKPQFITIRRAIAKDIDRLKALPSLDLVGVAVRIDQVIADTDGLPMLADEKPTAPAPPAKPARAKARPGAAKGADEPTLASQAQHVWQRWSDDMLGEVRQLIRVRSIETPEALMLSPSQAYFLRENLKLRLLNARLALLARNETAFRNDLVSAQDMLVRYFDARTKAVQSAQALLRQAQANNLAIEMPTLSDSLNAVRNYKAKP